MNFTIEVLLSDGRFFSQPCAAFDPVSISDFLPQRSCLLTPEGKNTGLAIWRRKTGSSSFEEYVVEDFKCERDITDNLEINCDAALSGSATYRFVPRVALGFNANGERVVDESKVLEGDLQKVWKCYKDNIQPHPPWFKLNIDSSLWRNSVGTVANTNPGTSARQDLYLQTISSLDKQT